MALKYVSDNFLKSFNDTNSGLNDIIFDIVRGVSDFAFKVSMGLFRVSEDIKDKFNSSVDSIKSTFDKVAKYIFDWKKLYIRLYF